MSGEDAGKSGEAGMKTGSIGILAIGLMIGVIIGVAVGAFVFPQTQTQSSMPTAANVLTPEEAGDKAVDFVATYLVPPGVEVSLINVTEMENANLYEIAVNLSMQGIAETRELYITKDGELLFPGGIDIEEFKELVEAQKEQEEI